MSEVEVHCAFDKLVKVGDLVPYPKNANQHSDHQIDILALLIGGNRKKKTKGNGWRVPITVSNQSGFIVRGHGRLAAAKKLKIKEVPVDFQDYETPELEKADRLADNQIPELAEIDMSILKGEFEDLLKLDFDMSLTGFESLDIDAALAFEMNNESPGLEDEVPKPPINQMSKPGDIWILGNHRLMCGDATSQEDVDKLMDGQKADMAFTDPPFDMVGMAYMQHLLRHSEGAVLVMHSDANVMRLAHKYADIFRYCLVHYYSFGFVRSQSMPQLAHHLIGVFGKPSFRSRGDGFKTVICEQLERDKLMPYQKRVAIPQRCIEHYSDGDVIDTFIGSGSTIIACEKIGRRCYGMERDPDCCDIAIKRWENYTGNKAEKSPLKTQ